MGQHKYNPTAIAAKNGELPPRPQKVGRRELDRWLQAGLVNEIHRRGLPTADDLRLGRTPYCEFR